MKPAAFYSGKEQTYIKHFFLERYLETLAFHIGYSFGELVYVDCFSGPWRADDEKLSDTSIRIALDQLKRVHDILSAKERTPQIEALFVEKDPTAFHALQRALTNEKGPIRTRALPGTFEENIPEILRHVGHRFAFFFIDPKGWTGLDMETIAPVLRHKPGEVMINFMYDFINRFTNMDDATVEQTFDDYFGTGAWRQVRKAEDRETVMVDCYREQIRRVGRYQFVTSTKILKPLVDRTYFNLVYATRHHQGIIEFRRIEKKTVSEQENVRDTAQRQFRERHAGQFELGLEPLQERSEPIRLERERRLSMARDRLLEVVRRKPQPYSVIEPLLLEFPLVWKEDVRRIIREAQERGLIDVLHRPERAEKGTGSRIIRLKDEGLV